LDWYAKAFAIASQCDPAVLPFSQSELSIATRVTGIDGQFSIDSPGLSSAPIGWLAQNLSYMTARIGIESFWQNIDYVKAARIPNSYEHQLPTELWAVFFRKSLGPAEARCVCGPS
jgi:hypothetical protein